MKTETVKHTPTPWNLKHSRHHTYIQGHRKDEFGNNLDDIALVSAEDAEFIVRACNAHDDLLKLARYVAFAVLPGIRPEIQAEAVAAVRKAEGGR